MFVHTFPTEVRESRAIGGSDRFYGGETCTYTKGKGKEEDTERQRNERWIPNSELDSDFSHSRSHHRASKRGNEGVGRHLKSLIKLDQQRLHGDAPQILPSISSRVTNSWGCPDRSPSRLQGSRSPL